MVEVDLLCPTCSSWGKINVQENLVKNSPRGIFAVNVAEFLVCDHTFIAYLDRNLECRDCFVSDFTVNLPKLNIDEKYDGILKNSSEVIDLFLILINIGALKLTYIIRGLLLRKKVVLINNLDIIRKHIENLLIFAIQGTFNYDFSILSQEEYKKNKKQYKNHLIIDDRKLINDKDKLFTINRLKIESSIVAKLFGENDIQVGLIFFKNEIWKAKEISGSIKNILKDHIKKKMSKRELIIKLREIYSIKIPFIYLEFILDILKYYDNFDLSALSGLYVPGLGV